MKINKNVLIVSATLFVVALSLTFCLSKILLKPKERPKAKVAIVIDDWGYNLRGLNLLKEIDVPVTLSILPNLRYSSKIAETAKDLGKEVILHLPLEPEIDGRDYIGLEKNTITVEMSKQEVIDNFKGAISSVPYVCGVSNHMGSRATKDEGLMSLIFTELKKRKLFFLDNLVVEESICRGLARKTRVKFASRDVFLDNLDNYEYIKGQFRELKEFALANGQAVGIAHAKQRSLQVLQEEIPLMQAEGIKFVFVSELTD